MTIHGAKKGGGKPRQPIIAPDSAQSKTYINILYGLGEGEIAGLVNGYKSVYLDDTPLQNDNGEFNFPNVKVDFRTGTNDQTHIDGFPDVASETNINVELKHGTPWVKSFNNLDLDAVRVRLKWGALRSQNAESGDVSGVRIDYAIDVKTDNGGWVQALATSINAKTSDAYERSHRIDLPPAQTGWQVRVRRITPNSTSDFVSDKMYISAITEVIDLKLRYPNTAVMGLRYDAESFSNVAKMSARCKGLIIKVPTNYDPVARTYTGMWDGQFKLAYSNNPAWVYYDLCTATRYGLGGRLKEYMIDKWSLYRLAQYCDQVVDDGMGGTEPRFTVNVYIQSAEGAFELLSKLAGVFRAISYWDGNSIVLDADIPQDSIYSFSRANVIDGVFEYTGTRARDRHTVAKVAWDNPANHFKTEYEYVRDEAAIAKFGVRVADIAAWGCTSKGQAQRAGLWALKSEQLETRMVTFKVGLDGYIPAPAKVIEISDELFAGRATGGRVLAINKAKTLITLDRTITAKAGDTLVINGDDGTSQRRQIKSVNGDKVTVTKAFTNISVENVWVLDSQDLATMKFRVLSVTADENHQFTITAVQYNPAKYDAIDTGAYIDERPISVINPTVQAPTKSVNLSSYHTVNQGVSITTLVIDWEQVSGAVKYQVEWRKDNGNWQALPPTGTNSIEIAGVYAGAYEARVTAISAFGQASLATHSNLTEIQGKIGKPTKLAKLTVQGVLFGMELGWLFGAKSEDTNYTEIQVSPDGRSNITTLGTFAYPTNKHEITGLQGNSTQYYRARIVDKLGNTSDWTAWVSGTTDASADKVLDIISGHISETHLDQTLREPIAKIGTIENRLNGIKSQIPSLQSAVNSINGQLPTLNTEIANAKRDLQTAQNTLNTAVANITTERNRITSAIRDITTLQNANNAKTAEIANLSQTVGGHTSSIRDLGVTTGDLSQKYTQIKTVADNATSEINTIKQTQAGQATSIERLGAKFDDLTVGGRNLLVNTNFPATARNKTSAWNYTAYRLSQPLVVGQTYTFSAEVIFNEGASSQVSVLSYKDRHTQEPQMQTVPVIGGKIKGSFVATVPNDDRLLFYAGVGGQTAGNVMTVRNAKLERGNVATDWTPAPEDTQAKLDEKASTASLDEFKSAQATKDEAISSRITALDAAYQQADTAVKSSVQSETQARISADNALSSRINALDTAYKQGDTQTNARLATLEQSVSSKDSALASRIDGLQANHTALERANNASITAEQKARADGDTALSNRLTALDSSYKQADNTLTARLTTEETARTNADSALGRRIDNMDSAYKSADNALSGRITTAQQTASDAQRAVATVQTELSARFDNLAVGGRNYIIASDVSRDGYNAGSSANLMVSDDIAGATTLILSADIEINGNPNTSYAIDNRAGVSTRIVYTDGSTQWFELWRTDANYKGRASRTLAVSANKTIASFNVCNLQTRLQASKVVVANPKLEIGTIATDWSEAPEDTQAKLEEFKTAQASKDSTTAQTLSRLQSELGGKATTAALNNLTTKVTQTDGRITAEAQKLSTLQTTVQGQTASIQQHAQSLNGLSAQWTLKVQSGNIVSGIGLASSNGVSDFAVRADKFYIASPNGQKGDTPFTVLTSPQVVNGVRVPAGTYIKDAFIANGSITMAKISDSIQSDNYVQGKSGWRLFKNGELEINSSFGDGTRIQLNSRGLTGWYGNGQKAFELGIFN